METETNLCLQNYGFWFYFWHVNVTGIAGLGVTYGINLNVLQASVIWNMCNAENKMISVERILQYSSIPSEAPLVIEECILPNNWPDVGTVSFRNLQVRLCSMSNTQTHMHKQKRVAKYWEN